MLKAASKKFLELASKPPPKSASMPRNGHEVEEVPELAKRRAAKWGLQVYLVTLLINYTYCSLIIRTERDRLKAMF
jgi:hypothetical protein